MDVFFKFLASFVVGVVYFIGVTCRSIGLATNHVVKVGRRLLSKRAQSPALSADKELPVFSALPEHAGGIPEIADEYQSVVFNQSFNASLGIYKKSGRIKRVIRPSTAAAEALLMQRYNLKRWNLADMYVSPTLSLEEIILWTEEEGNKAIQEFLKSDGPQFRSQIQKLRETLDRNAGLISAVVPPDVVDRAVTALHGDSAKPVATAPVVAPDPIAMTLPVVTPVAEVVRSKRSDRSQLADVTGTVIVAEVRDMTEFKTFEAAIRSDADGESASFRGVRLQEIFQEQNIRVGDRIRLVSLEPTKVDGSAKTRNEYQVTVLARAAVAA